MRKIYVPLVATILISAMPAFAQPKVPSNVAAVVNGESITKAQLATKAVDWQGAMTLDLMIDSTVVSQEAKKAGVVVTDAEVNAKLNEMKKALAPSQDFDTVLRQNGMTAGLLFTRIKMRLQADGVIKNMIKKSPAIIANYRKAEHILIRVDENTSDPSGKTLEAKDADAKAKIEKIADEIKTKTISFEDAAKKYSEDPVSKVNGGNLGFFTKGVMAPPFEAATFSLKAGDVSAPVKTNYGYHLIKLIAIGSDAKGDDLKKLEDQIVKDQLEPWFTSIRKSAKIENILYPVKIAPKPAAPKKASPAIDAPPAPPVGN